MFSTRFVFSLVASLGIGMAALACPIHVADQNQDYRINFTELSRLIQFYNVGDYQCGEGTEDGYAIGAGDNSCAPHELDYNPQNWKISLTELLRLIQIYNGGGYYACAEGEDGYCFRPREDPPNVFLLVLDTLRADRIGRTRDGALIMPYLTGLLASSTNFVNAWSPSGWTEPSMSSMFTGRYPEHYVLDVPQSPGGQSTSFDITEEDEVLAEWLARNGYSNWGVQANAFIQPDTILGQGFTAEQYDFMNGGTAMMMTDAALARFDTLKALNAAKKPFFFYMQYMDAHAPFTPVIDFEYPFNPEPTLTGADAVYLQYSFWGQYFRDLLLNYFDAAPRQYADLSPTGVEVLQSRYDRDCYFMDYHLERLMTAYLEEFPNTVLIITADHGESMIDRGQIIGHSHSIFEEQVHVPFAIHLPGGTPKTVTRRVSNMSILPTLARILQLPPESQWEGFDVLCAEESNAPEEPIFAFTRSTLFGNRIEAKAVVDGDLKLVDDNKFGTPKLYNLVTDPGELTDLSGTLPDDFARLTALLAAHEAAVGL